MASSPQNNAIGEGEEESDETSGFFCGHVNFPEMNRGIRVYEGTKLNNHTEGGGGGGGGSYH